MFFPRRDRGPLEADVWDGPLKRIVIVRQLCILFDGIWSQFWPLIMQSNGFLLIIGICVSCRQLVSKVVKRGQFPKDYSLQSVPTSETAELREKNGPRTYPWEAATIVGRYVLKLCRIRKHLQRLFWQQLKEKNKEMDPL